jgi:hypothetical protein
MKYAGYINKDRVIIIMVVITLSLSAFMYGYKHDKSSCFSVGTGFILDALPLAESQMRVLVLDFVWKRNILGTVSGFSTFGCHVGMMAFYVIPFPYLGVQISLLPRQAAALTLDTGIFYEMIYGGLFGFEIKFGILFQNTISVSFLFLATPFAPAVRYPTSPAQLFKRYEIYDSEKLGHFPDFFFGVLINYNTKKKNKEIQ